MHLRNLHNIRIDQDFVFHFLFFLLLIKVPKERFNIYRKSPVYNINPKGIFRHIQFYISEDNLKLIFKSIFLMMNSLIFDIISHRKIFLGFTENAP
jgi:hypothetical protein